MIDIHQTPEYAKYLSKTGWIVERHAEINYFIRKFPVVGSAIKIQRPEEIRTAQTIKLSKKYRAFQIIYEPKNALDAKYLLSCGYKLSKSPFLPTKTIQLDLTQSKEDILKQMKKDARYAIRKTQSSKLKAQNISNIEEFRNSWKKAVGLKRYVPPLQHLMALKKSFKNNCVLYSCINTSKQIIGGSIFLKAGKIAYYWQAFTDKEGRKSLAQYRLVWEGILWAKAHGVKIFDFEGVYDSRFPNKRWLGFTHFKKSFGGEEIEYPGAYTKLSLFAIPKISDLQF